MYFGIWCRELILTFFHMESHLSQFCLLNMIGLFPIDLWSRPFYTSLTLSEGGSGVSPLFRVLVCPFLCQNTICWYCQIVRLLEIWNMSRYLVKWVSPSLPPLSFVLFKIIYDLCGLSFFHINFRTSCWVPRIILWRFLLLIILNL